MHQQAAAPAKNRINEKGFTLIEITVSLVILLIIITTVSFAFIVSLQVIDLNTQAQSISNILEVAREDSLIRLNNTQYGVFFNSAANTFTLFQGTTYTAGASTNQVYTLPSDVKITNINTGAANTIVFNLITGSVFTTAPATVTLQNSIGNAQKIINVNAQGTSTIQ